MGIFLKNTQSKKIGLTKLLILAGIGGILGVGAYGAYKYGLITQKIIQEKQAASTVDAKAKRNIDLYEKASNARLKGDYTTSQKVYDDAIRQSESTDEKAGLLVSKATNAINAQKYDEAIELVRQSESIKPSLAATQAMIIAAEAKNDKILALTYYRKEITQLDKVSPVYSQDMEQLQEKIKALEGPRS